MALRHELHARGLRYRVCYGRADIAFPKHKLAVFVDGCFWHGCPKHYHAPKTNQEYWEDKREQNRLRDLGVVNILHLRGWRSLRFWEHDLAEADGVRKAADLVMAELRAGALPVPSYAVKPPVVGGSFSLGRGASVSLEMDQGLAQVLAEVGTQPGG
jgi:DNA mismatch endonuclease (patch repair protein)